MRNKYCHWCSVAACYAALQRVVLRCSRLCCVATGRAALQRVALRHNALRCVATGCAAVQRVVPHCREVRQDLADALLRQLEGESRAWQSGSWYINNAVRETARTTTCFSLARAPAPADDSGAAPRSGEAAAPPDTRYGDARTHSRARARAHTHTHTHTHTRSHTHTSTHSHAHSLAHSHAHVCTHTRDR